MQRISKIFEYGYLVIAIVFIVETFLNWKTNRNKAYLLLLFAVLAVFMYFFRKRFRNKINRRN